MFLSSSWRPVPGGRSGRFSTWSDVDHLAVHGPAIVEDTQSTVLINRDATAPPTYVSPVPAAQTWESRRRLRLVQFFHQTFRRPLIRGILAALESGVRLFSVLVLVSTTGAGPATSLGNADHLRRVWSRSARSSCLVGYVADSATRRDDRVCHVRHRYDS